MSERSIIRRHSDRAVPDEVASILADGHVAHIGFVVDGQPFVIPLLYHVDSDALNTVYVHGSIASRVLKHLATGAPASLAITIEEGIVLSKTALNHSSNYRSVVGFGNAHMVTDSAIKAAMFERMIARYVPGRTANVDYQPPSLNDLRATEVIVIDIEEWSAKARRGGPTGPLDNDPTIPGTVGVIDLRPQQ